MEIKKYIPILRAKAGEFEALKKLSPVARNLLTPLLEIKKPNTPKDKPAVKLDVHLQKVAKNCATSWDSETAILIDTPNLSNSQETESGENAIVYFYNELSRRLNKIIPIVTTDRDDVVCRGIKKISTSFMFRVRKEDIEMPAATTKTIEAQLNELEVNKNQCHLLIDLRYIPDFDADSLLDLISSFTNEINASDWMSVTLSGCSFPEDMTGIKKNETVKIPRKEFEGWKDLNQSHPMIGVILGFSDYCIINPVKPDLEGFSLKRIATKIRYTADNYWHIYRGESPEAKDEKYDEYQALSTQIVADSKYQGSEYSWGDKCIMECSNGSLKWCAPVKWISIDINHHLTFVSQQIYSHLESL